MKWNAFLIALLAAALFAATGCEDKKEGDGDKGGKTEAKALEWETKTDDAMGYSLSVPKGSKELAKSEYGHTYSYVLEGGMFEINLHVTPAGQKDLDQLVNLATMMGQKKIKEKKAIEGGGFMVLKEPQGVLEEMWVSKGTPEGGVTVKCSAPKEQHEAMVKACNSLAYTKK